jgi:hypothetical protein
MWDSSARSSVTSATFSPRATRGSVVITELEVASPDEAIVNAGNVAAPADPDGGPVDDDEASWTTVVSSAHHRRKARGKAKVHGDAVRKSKRLAAQESAMHLDMTKKAVNFRALKDALKGCSSKLQAHVSKSKVLQKLASPMGAKSVSALRAAALGRDGLVSAGADD